MSPIDIVIVALVVLAAAGALWLYFHRKKAGKSCCGECEGCSGCAAATKPPAPGGRQP